MPIFTVHEPPNPPADRYDRAERLRFVRDGFSWPAALFAPFWLIWRRLWLALLLYLVAIVALEWLAKQLGLEETSVAVAMIALHVLLGLEADTIERWTLSRNKWTEVGSVVGRNRLECERRFLTHWLPAQPLIRDDALSRSQMSGVDARPLFSPSERRSAGAWRSAFPFRLRH